MVQFLVFIFVWRDKNVQNLRLVMVGTCILYLFMFLFYFVVVFPGVQYNYTSSLLWWLFHFTSSLILFTQKYVENFTLFSQRVVFSLLRDRSSIFFVIRSFVQEIQSFFFCCKILCVNYVCICMGKFFAMQYILRIMYVFIKLYIQYVVYSVCYILDLCKIGLTNFYAYFKRTLYGKIETFLFLLWNFSFYIFLFGGV
eukprot:TRINITY_DN4212_c0_g2_i1.p4 TRINITY_DN4212_c0_g2~~TRINITY_DN4212_c0_g2_i1.p4  ORF type:complete len:198 (+),score=-12.79 TRINITY_DN4212_c0_g2_i1:1014-1607(+)